jgi:UDP-N-acetylmuramyl tripeptide synthase
MPKQRPSLRAFRAGSRLRGSRPSKRTSESQESPESSTNHNSSSPRPSLRAGLAVVGGRTAGALSRRLHLGGGTSIVGLVAQRVYPDIVGHLATQLQYGSIAVTGTNGKTTTSGFVADILAEAGLRVWRNREGSNLMGGIASSLVMRALPTGNLRRSGKAISIFEVDEAVIPQVLPAVVPRVAVFTNLFRDQLDRYGEVDSVASRWQQAIRTLAPDTILVLNADDPTIASLGDGFSGRVLYFGIDDSHLDLANQTADSESHQVIDTHTCPQCGGDYTYDIRFFSHMGHYHCTNCGRARPQPHVRATHVQSSDFDRQHITVTSSLATTTSQHDMVVPLPGLYNVYNALAAITVVQSLEIDWQPIVTGIESFQPIFGRGERLEVEGRTVRLLLAKNPTGFNEVLRTLFSEAMQRHVLFVLNDNIADGRDVSWIWDVDFERVIGHTATLVIAGSRALDLALRLKYAGMAREQITIIPPAPLRAVRKEVARHNRYRREKKNNNAVTSITDEQITSSQRYGITQALDMAIQQTPVGETLFIVPTYTGLLEIHRELERRGLTPHYWEEQ